MTRKDEIKESIEQLLDGLFEIVRDKCINELSANVLFIAERITEENIAIQTNKEYELGLFYNSRISLEELIEIIDFEYDLISWVDMTILYTDRYKTIVLSKLLQLNKISENIHYHCGIRLPYPNFQKNEKKFDINTVL